MTIKINRLDRELFPTISPVLDLGDGVEWTFTTSVEADVTVTGGRMSVTMELCGQVSAWMTGCGKVTEADVSGLLTSLVPSGVGPSGS